MFEPRVHATAETAGQMAAMARTLGWRGMVAIVNRIEDIPAVRTGCGEMPVKLAIETAGRLIPRPAGTDRLYYIPKDMEDCRKAIERRCGGIAGWWTKEVGINFVLAKLAAECQVPICFDFSALLHSSRRKRIEVMSSMQQAGRMARAYHTPVLVSSGAHIPWELRSPSDLLSFGRVLGLEDVQIKAGWRDW